MKPIAKLKERARAHEQREEWAQAIELYLQALQAVEEGAGEAELALYNRVGDLYLRLGQPANAVRFYEEAAARYAAAGLYNNAIALCSKALRHMPERAELYRKLGEYSAAQGFLVDARRWLLEYAERVARTGDLGSALAAMRELAETTGDPAIREILGRQLQAHGRTEEAVAELRVAYWARLRAGELEAAEALQAEILALDPEADLTPRGAAEPAAEAGAAAGAEAALPEFGSAPYALPDDDVSSAGGAAPAAAVEEGIGLVSAAEAAGIVAAEWPVPGGEPPQAPAEGVEPTWGGAVPPGAAAVRARARALVEEGRVAEAVEALDVAHRALADAGRIGEALEVVGELVELDPDRVRAHQQRVEYAFQLEDPAAQLRAYLDLAACLERTGEPERALAVYERVLDLDPGNAVARSALAEAGRLAGAGESAEYVDLGDLLRADVEETTRFVVAEEEPTGDEERDFAEMLAQFKAKLAEHVSPDDLAAHYDLGVAFKEMGLVDEAIAQFQIALRSGNAPLKVYEELGHCFLLKEQHGVALRILTRALEVPRRDETDLLGVYYHLGRCYEALGRPAEAREAYERVFGMDIHFRDVAERLQRL